MENDHPFLPLYSTTSGIGQEVLPDLYCYTNQIVNLCCVDQGFSSKAWVLIDAGMPRSAERLETVIAERYGEKGRPRAIILTHGHFDHVGALPELAEKWDVPVYAHEAELPYLTGRMSYPQPDGTVEGGLVAKLSPLFPNGPIDLKNRVNPLPADGSVPHLPGWRWLHTPGHTPGHISLFRDDTRALIAGDAFVTVKQEYLYQVVKQEKEISGPPRYLTPDWEAAWESVRALAALKPAIAVTGHGVPMAGKELTEGLERLAEQFDRIAIPEHGRYVKNTPV